MLITISPVTFVRVGEREMELGQHVLWLVLLAGQSLLAKITPVATAAQSLLAKRTNGGGLELQ